MYQVVIIEDNPMVSMLNRSFTEKDRRFRVAQEFQNGRQALSYLLKTPTDLVILDVFMPVLTGLELLRALRGSQVPLDVIMVTAANDTKTLDALLKLGITDYLVKPFTYQRFQQALDAFCRQRAAIAGSASVSQSEIDRMLRTPAGGEASPKGLQEKTLAHLRSCLAQSPDRGHTSEEISALVGLSTVTVRRYMNYMLENGEAESRINYDTGGRPSMLYHYTACQTR